MATRRRKFGLGILFVCASSLVLIHIFHDKIIETLGPYTGGKSICDKPTGNSNLSSFSSKDCPRIKQSAENLVNTVETVLLVLVIVLVAYILVKWLIQRLRRSSV